MFNKGLKEVERTKEENEYYSAQWEYRMSSFARNMFNEQKMKIFDRSEGKDNIVI